MSARKKISKPLIIIWMDACVAYFVSEYVSGNSDEGVITVHGAYKGPWG